MTIQAFHTFQDGATATGNGAALRVRGAGGVVVDVIISDTATVVAEGKIGDSGTWRTLRLLAMASGATATSATASGHFGIDVRGLDEVRLRVSAYTAGAVTVTGRALADGEAVGSDVVTATISGTPSVSVSGTPTVSVSGTVTVDTELAAAAAIPTDDNETLASLTVPVVRALVAGKDASTGTKSSLLAVGAHPTDAAGNAVKNLYALSYPLLFNGSSYDRERATIDANAIADPGGASLTTTQTSAELTNSTTVTATGITHYLFYPGAASGLGYTFAANTPLPRTFRIKVAHSASGGWRYVVDYCLMV